MNLLTVSETADFLRRSRSHVNRLSLQGRIPSVKLGTRRVFVRETLEQWVKEQEGK